MVLTWTATAAKAKKTIERMAAMLNGLPNTVRISLKRGPYIGRSCLKQKIFFLFSGFRGKSKDWIGSKHFINKFTKNLSASFKDMPIHYSNQFIEVLKELICPISKKANKFIYEEVTCNLEGFVIVRKCHVKDL